MSQKRQERGWRESLIKLEQYDKTAGSIHAAYLISGHQDGAKTHHFLLPLSEKLELYSIICDHERLRLSEERVTDVMLYAIEIVAVIRLRAQRVAWEREAQAFGTKTRTDRPRLALFALRLPKAKAPKELLVVGVDIGRELQNISLYPVPSPFLRARALLTARAINSASGTNRVRQRTPTLE